MNNISIDVQNKLDSFPSDIKEKVLLLKELIYKVAKEENIKDLVETLKWGEVSYLAKGGSTIRIGSSKKTNEYGIYFNCKTKLIKTFRVLFPDIFNYEGNRAIIFTLNDDIHKKELEYCILLALTYHKRKHLDMLDSE